MLSAPGVTKLSAQLVHAWLHLCVFTFGVVGQESIKGVRYSEEDCGGERQRECERIHI